ncbi:MAG: energy transducer TonB [Acidobacteriota bacterium]
MFEESLVESTPLLRSRNRAPVLTSIAIQASIAAAIITIPLMHPEIIPMHAPKIELIAPRFTPPTPPPQPVHVAATTAASAAPSAPAAASTQSLAIRQLIDVLTGPAVDAPSTPNIIMGSGAPGIPTGISTTPSPHVTAAPAAAIGPLHISTGVSAGLLLAPIHPIYPSIAKIAHVEGVVIVQAIISTTGHIESAHVVSGSPMLAQSALDAVRDARYRPYFLNNQPTEVDTTFTITFRLGSS